MKLPTVSEQLGWVNVLPIKCWTCSRWAKCVPTLHNITWQIWLPLVWKSNYKWLWSSLETSHQETLYQDCTMVQTVFQRRKLTHHEGERNCKKGFSRRAVSLWFSADWAFPFPLVPLPAIWFPRPALPCPDIIMVGVVIVMGLISSEFSFRNPPVRRTTQLIFNKHATSVASYPGLPTQVSVAGSIS